MEQYGCSEGLEYVNEKTQSKADEKTNRNNKLSCFNCFSPLLLQITPSLHLWWSITAFQTAILFYFLCVEL
ncbi:hypothetical protein BT69DRAFT_1278267, partial [Atractiella rhizophila]